LRRAGRPWFSSATNSGTDTATRSLRQNDGEYGGVQYAKHRLAYALFEQSSVRTKTVANALGIVRSTADRTIDALEDGSVLEDITGGERNREHHAKEIFEILERPLRTY
jgi:Fic family protein